MSVATIRMYRQGLGDCFLVSLARSDGSPYTMLIDFGVLLGTPNASTLMRRVARDIASTVSHRINLLIATHEHWDHLSGFVQAKDVLENEITFDETWLPWTEDPADDLANRIVNERYRGIEALRERRTKLRALDMAEAADEVDSLLAFYGGAAGGTTKEALDNVRARKPVRYCSPSDPPVSPEGGGFRLYVLGPPRDPKALRKVNPSKAHPETYGLAVSEVARRLLFDGAESPFGPAQSIPWRSARSMPFFRDIYFAPETGYGLDPDWRRIDADGLDDSTDLALQLDNATNNSCLVIAIELSDGRVLLFPGDAQVGNWLSWERLEWQVGDRKVTGEDLLSRTAFYKVGHHGSHNATLRELGLERMRDLLVAMVPVDRETALKRRWNAMPYPKLMKALAKKAQRGVVRSDKAAQQRSKVKEGPDGLYYEVTL